MAIEPMAAQALKQPTFKDDGYKVIRCPNCHRVLGNKTTGKYVTVNLGSTKIGTYTCFNPKCRNIFKYKPPGRVVIDNQPKFKYGDPMAPSYTSDETMS